MSKLKLGQQDIYEVTTSTKIWRLEKQNMIKHLHRRDKYFAWNDVKSTDIWWKEQKNKSVIEKQVAMHWS